MKALLLFEAADERSPKSWIEEVNNWVSQAKDSLGPEWMNYWNRFDAPESADEVLIDTRPVEAEINGLSQATATELALWSEWFGAGLCKFSYSWREHNPATEELGEELEDSLAMLEEQLVEGEIEAEIASFAAACPGDWFVPSHNELLDARWILLTTECNASALLFAAHWVSPTVPFPIVEFSWRDELGMILYGRSAQEAARELVNEVVRSSNKAAKL